MDPGFGIPSRGSRVPGPTYMSRVPGPGYHFSGMPFFMNI